MNPIDPGASQTQAIAAVLSRAPFAATARPGTAVLVVGETPTRVLFANDSARALFRTKSLERLSDLVIAGASPGARRLRELANTLTLHAPPRLELLRFFVDRLPLQTPLLCARVAGARGEPFLVVAAAVAVQAAAAEEAPPAAKESAPSLVEFDENAERARLSARFLWSVDDQSRFEGAAAKSLVDAVGDSAPRVAEQLSDLKARTGLDEAGTFAQALASRATFGPLRLCWPRAGRADGVVVLLSGAPIFDGQRRFLGYRGFGVATQEIAPVAARPPAGGGLLDPSASAADDAPPSREWPDEQRLAAPSPAAASEPEPPATLDRRLGLAPARTTLPGFAGPNVVPLRPGPARAVAALDEAARRGEGDRESIELSNHERDAFREIARALGAKTAEQASPAEEARADSAAAGEPEGAPARNLADAVSVGDGERRDERNPSVHGALTGAERNAVNLLDRLPIGAAVARGDDLLYLNRTLLDLLGYRDLAEFRAASGLATMFRRGEDGQGAPSGDGVVSLIAANGEAIAVDGQIELVEWDGAPATLISVRRSLQAEFGAKLRNAEREARARETEARELSAILDTATDGILMLDAKGVILSMNRPGEALFGVDQNEVAGEPFFTLLLPESHQTFQSYFDGLQASGMAGLLNGGREAMGRERRGRAIPLLITLGRIASSPETKYCAVLRDLTQSKTAERELQEARGQAEKASALKSEFLAKVSHELRTPLNAILGFAEVILGERFGPVGNERYKEYLGDIRASGAHVLSLVNDLLDLSKIEAGKLDLTFAAVDANRVIQECVSLIQPQAAHERIIMRLSLFDKLPRILADERSLRQIMLNLMSNAVKFNEPGGQVIVSTAVSDSGQAVIRVRDTGIGMSDDEIGAALQPFQQIATARPTRGTGLGLPLTKALVEANRAGFSIRSRKEQGTLVEVAFPTAQAAAQ